MRAHGGLRRILSNYIKLQPEHFVFQYGDAGKPTLARTSGRIEFNLSTSEDLAIVALSADEPVGIDCERVRPRRELDAIARRMFSRDLAAGIASTAPAQRLTAFTLAWTALEAQVKADGRGLFRSREEPPMPDLQVLHCVPHAGFIAAVARAKLPPVAQWHTFMLD